MISERQFAETSDALLDNKAHLFLKHNPLLGMSLPQSSMTRPADFTPPWTLWRHWQNLKGAFYPKDVSIPPADLRGKSILITGANSGIGRETALLFASWGATDIILACRPNPPSHEPHPEAVVEECRAAALAAAGDGHLNDTTRIEWWECDMASLASVEALATRYIQTGKPLDMLINNAGLPEQKRRTPRTQDGFDLLQQVNFLSHTLLTLSLLPALAKAEAPRITYTTSSMHYLTTFNPDNLHTRDYASNKLYLQIWLTELQVRMAAVPEYSHIIAHGLHPGFVYSGIWETGIWTGRSTNAANGSWLLWFVTKLLDTLAINSKQGSLAIANAATGLENGLRSGEDDKLLRGGARYFNRIWPEEPMPHVRSATYRKRVWEYVALELKLQERSSLSPETKSFAA